MKPPRGMHITGQHVSPTHVTYQVALSRWFVAWLLAKRLLHL